MKYVFNRFDGLEHTAIILIFVEIKWIRYSCENPYHLSSFSSLITHHPFDQTIHTSFYLLVRSRKDALTGPLDRSGIAPKVKLR